MPVSVRAVVPRGLTGLPRPFWVLFGGTLVNRVAAFVEPFLAFYLTRSRGFSIAEAGVVLAVMGAGNAVSQLVGGVLADRIGRRRTMVLGLSTSAVALLGLGAASTLPQLTLAAGAYGLTTTLFRPAVNAAITDLVPPQERRRAYALNFWAINLGFSVATPLGGFLAARGYWTLFLLDAATSLTFALLILRGVPETRPEPTGEETGTGLDVLRDRLLRWLVVGVTLQASVYTQAFVTLPLVVDADGLGPEGYGVAIGLNGVLIIVLQPLLLGLLGRLDRGRLLLTAMVLQGVGFGLHALADSVAGHAGAVVVWTVGEVIQAGLLTAVVADLAPPHLRGRYMGAFGVSFGLAAVLAPLVGTQVLQRAGDAVLLGGAGLLSAAAGLLLLRVSGAAARRNGVPGAAPASGSPARSCAAGA